jgi:hypothetical protein
MATFASKLKPLLPFEISHSERLLIVLDLDLTLINARSVLHGSPTEHCDFVVTNEELRAMGYPLADDQRNVYIRPGLRHFLKEASQVGDLVVWTLSQIELALKTVEKLDVDHCIKGVIGRDGTVFRGASTAVEVKDGKFPTCFDPGAALPPALHEGLRNMNSQVNKPFFVKDLSALGHDMSRTVIVDDWPDLCVFNPHNALIVEGFEGPRSDSPVKDGPDMSYRDDDVLVGKVLPVLKGLQMGDVRLLLQNCGVREELSKRCFAHNGEYFYDDLLRYHLALCLHSRPWISNSRIEHKVLYSLAETRVPEASMVDTDTAHSLAPMAVQDMDHEEQEQQVQQQLVKVTQEPVAVLVDPISGAPIHMPRTLDVSPLSPLAPALAARAARKAARAAEAASRAAAVSASQSAVSAASASVNGSAVAASAAIIAESSTGSASSAALACVTVSASSDSDGTVSVRRNLAFASLTISDTPTPAAAEEESDSGMPPRHVPADTSSRKRRSFLAGCAMSESVLLSSSSPVSLQETVA